MYEVAKANDNKIQWKQSGFLEEGSVQIPL